MPRDRNMADAAGADRDWQLSLPETQPARLKMLDKDGPLKIAPDHRNHSVGLELLMDALGTSDEDFLNGILGQLAMGAGRQGAQLTSAGSIS
jgi:hypothetical protein